MKFYLVLAVLWLPCSVITFGCSNGYWRGQHPSSISEIESRKDFGVSFLFSIGGPASLVVVTAMSGGCYHGLSYEYKAPDRAFLRVVK